MGTVQNGKTMIRSEEGRLRRAPPQSAPAAVGLVECLVRVTPALARRIRKAAELEAAGTATAAALLGAAGVPPGRIVNVGRLGGAKGEFDFDLHALKRIDYIGVTFRTRSLEEVREITRRMRADLWSLVEAGKLTLPIDRTFPLEEAAAALAHMRSNAHFGKIVLTVR